MVLPDGDGVICASATTHAIEARMVLPIADRLRFHARSIDLGLLKLPKLGGGRNCAGLFASMSQSGEHWTRYMLTLILVKLYDLPPPVHAQDRSIVSRPIYQHIPRIINTTSVPHYLLRTRTPSRWLHLAKHLVLVRDLRDSLISNYEKRNNEYNVDFSTYLRGDVRRKKYRADIWSRIHFLNGWGAVVERHPERIAVLKYEELLADTHGQLARICDYFHIEGVTPELLDEVVAASTKTEMAKRLDPNKPGSPITTDAPADEWYSDADRRFLAEVCRRYLKHTFGYRYW